MHFLIAPSERSFILFLIVLGQKSRIPFLRLFKASLREKKPEPVHFELIINSHFKELTNIPRKVLFEDMFCIRSLMEAHRELKIKP